MYWLLRSKEPEKVKEGPLPKTGKIFLFLFFLFHVIFLGFNFYYFIYYVGEEVAEGKDIGVDTVDGGSEPPIEA